MKTIELSEGQQQTLDGLLTAAFEHQERTEEAKRETFSAFSAAVEAGDGEAARELAERIRKTASDLARERANLILEGGELLSDRQRQRLLEASPQTFRRDWLLSSRTLRMARGRGHAAQRRREK